MTKFNTMKLLFLPLFFILTISSCKTQPIEKPMAPKPLLGADLSYVNEVEDEGGVYKNKGQIAEPYQLFADYGCQIVRLRLWHQPSWNKYSGWEDVKRSISRAKKSGMKVLLDFHYSDTWADPGHQSIPEAWSKITSQNILGDSLFQYTYSKLDELNTLNLVPDIVQIGNEINSEILQPTGTVKNDIDWKRNAFLISKGIEAVKTFNKNKERKVEIMLHIAQPENAGPWFSSAELNGLTDFDWIGLSYYPLWSKVSMEQLPSAISGLVKTFKKKLLIVETAYPHTFFNADPANNILDQKALITGISGTPDGQLQYLNKLVELTTKGGGAGIIYWEPAWISSKAKTPWGDGSHWDNATFFDATKGNEALQAFSFFNTNK